MSHLLSGVGYDYGADRTIAPAGLSPAGTAAYWAALLREYSWAP